MIKKDKRLNFKKESLRERIFLAEKKNTFIIEWTAVY
jgi:hypothetical protein